MPKSKENNLFEKIVKRDYKNELEEVIEHKNFDENAQSLLLEIIYKIEAAYKDYETIKQNSKSKDDYFENFINIIHKKCKTIKIVRPNSEESKILDNKTFIVNKKSGEIICLPIARKLLYAISKIGKKDLIVNKKYSILSVTMSNMINVGDNINMVEPLRDFNGWSWTTVSREYESIEYNLIYQILLILVGEEIFKNWTNCRDTIVDYFEEFEELLIKKYGPKLAEEILYTVKKISVLMEIKVNPNIKEKIEKSKNNVEKELDKFENKQEYIRKLTVKKNRLSKKIMEIDSTISDKKLLQEEYVKRNAKLSLEEKIFSMRVLAEMMIAEREEYFREMTKYNELLKPKNFLLKKEELKNEYNILCLADIKDEEKELKERLLDLQLLFLECFKIKIKRNNSKAELIKLIYQFRYYSLLPYEVNRNICEVNEILEKIKEVEKLLIKKIIENKVVISFSQNENINYEIVKNIFKVRIIYLEDLSIKIMKEKEGFFIQLFDDKAFEKKINLDIENLDKKMLKIRLNKKVKIFE